MHGVPSFFSGASSPPEYLRPLKRARSSPVRRSAFTWNRESRALCFTNEIGMRYLYDGVKLISLLNRDIKSYENEISFRSEYNLALAYYAGNPLEGPKQVTIINIVLK